MQACRTFFRIIAILMLIVTTIIMSFVVAFNMIIPSQFNVVRGDTLDLPTINQISAEYNMTTEVNLSTPPRQLNLKLFNIIPIKTTSINIIDDKQLVPGGTPFGIKLFTKGVMVIDVNGIETDSGIQNPAKLAGIMKGDVLLAIDSISLTSNEQVAEIMEQSGGKNLVVTLERGGKMIKTIIKPVLSYIDNKYKGGIWVRDSSAGIGTVTYYDDSTLNFAGLGHGICDVDTGKIMPLNSGEVCDVRINSVQRGRAGTPGELRGGFTDDNSCGSLYTNNESGIFGTLDTPPNQLEPVDLKLKQNVRRGAATIISTIDDEGPKEYDIIIEKIDLNPRTLTKNMVISVVDEELLEKTGGIVQGMSGSPILQDGELVGAVTHVFVNNPQKGYGIFIENMLERAS